MVQVFITEFIKNIYLGQVMYNIQSSIDSATKGNWDLKVKKTVAVFFLK